MQMLGQVNDIAVLPVLWQLLRLSMLYAGLCAHHWRWFHRESAKSYA